MKLPYRIKGPVAQLSSAQLLGTDPRPCPSRPMGHLSLTDRPMGNRISDTQGGMLMLRLSLLIFCLSLHCYVLICLVQQNTQTTFGLSVFLARIISIISQRETVASSIPTLFLGPVPEHGASSTHANLGDFDKKTRL